MKHVAIILYAAGAFVSGSQYHKAATERCVDNIYPRTVLLMAGWPVFNVIINIAGETIVDRCEAKP